MIETHSYASMVMHSFCFPNTYTFTKCVCEHLLLRDKDVHTIIIRPCIVGPSVQHPFEGWAGDKPSTLVAAACLYLKYQYNLWSFRKEQAPVIPVDVVCRFVLAKSFLPTKTYPSSNGIVGSSAFKDGHVLSGKRDGNSVRNDSPIVKQLIYTAAWDTLSPGTSGFLWCDYAFAITQLGSVKGHVDRVASYIGLFITFKIFLSVNLTYDKFRILHRSFVCAPLSILNSLCHKVGWKPLFLRKLEKIRPFLDLPLLFFPFTTRTFHFQSQLIAPKSMNGERYMFNCALAAESFVNAIENKITGGEMAENRAGIRSSDKHADIQIIAGRNHISKSWDSWWAMTQPMGNYAIRLIGWIVIKLLRRITTEVSVDLNSFALAMCAAENIKEEGSNEPCIVLVPTHRSFLDFILLSFLAFSLPELGIKVPYIAAADDFSRIPLLGWFARASGAFFLKRGKGSIDPGLLARLQYMKEKNCPFCVEVFLEGKRSRDRRFLYPKTGFLKCLCETGCEHVILPIAINYERIPEQTELISEIEGKSRTKLSLTPLLKWLKKVWGGKVQLGRIYLSAASPLLMKPVTSLKVPSVARALQQLQQSKVVVSSFHLDAGASVLDIQSATMKEALSMLKCPLWPTSNHTEGKPLILPESLCERWTIFLHYGHYFAPFFSTSHPKWSSWLNTCGERCDQKLTEKNDNIDAIVASLARSFDLSDNAVADTLTWLQEKGFSSPSSDHVFQYVQNFYPSIPPVLTATAIEFQMDLLHSNNIFPVEPSCSIEPLFEQNKSYHQSGNFSTADDESVVKMTSMESYGAWGFRDSKFIVCFERDGTKYVTMKGKRYKISGKQLPNLISFLEKESGLEVNILQVTLNEARTPSLSKSELSELDFDKLRKVLSNDKSRFSMQSTDRVRHGTGHSQEDMFMIRSGRMSVRVPDGIAFPKDEAEVEKLIRLATKEKWCLIPFGGGTNVSHATRCPTKKIDPRPIISVDMKLMKKILEIDEENGTAHIQAGIKGSDLVRQLESRGFTIGHEPDSIEFSTLGGWIATKASGMKQNKYGNIENIVKEVRVAGPNGMLWQNQGGAGPSFGRVSTGVDLSSLIFGSEGSFGIITSAVVKISLLPEVKEYESIVLHKFDDGLRFIGDVTKMGAMKPASVRLLDNQQFRLGQALKATNDFFSRIKNNAFRILGSISADTFHPDKMVCATIAYEGSCVEVKLQKRLVKEFAAKHGGFCAGSEIGKAGYDMTYAIAYLRDFIMTYGFLAESFETFVPWSRVTAVITATKDCIKKEHQERALPGIPLVNCRITQLYGEGVCVYFYFCMNFTNVQNPSRVFSEIEIVARRTILQMGGSLSHHHGIGKLRVPFIKSVYPDNMKKVCNALKLAFDPENVFGVRNGIYHS